MGPRRSGKTTLLDAAKACEEEDKDFHCSTTYSQTSVDHKDRWGNGLHEFSILGTRFSFFVSGDWGGDPEYLTQILQENNLKEIKNIVYCFDVNKMFSDDSFEIAGRTFSTAAYTLGFVRFLLRQMESLNKKIEKNIIFLGTHGDLLTEEKNMDEIKQKLDFETIQKEINLQFSKIKVCAVCGSWLDYEHSVRFWVDIAEALIKTSNKK